MAAKIAQKSAAEPKAHPEASREPFGRDQYWSRFGPRGLTFELFRGARLLRFACFSFIAGALF